MAINNESELKKTPTRPIGQIVASLMEPFRRNWIKMGECVYLGSDRGLTLHRTGSVCFVIIYWNR